MHFIFGLPKYRCCNLIQITTLYSFVRWHFPTHGKRCIDMDQCKTAATPLLTHWSYCSLSLGHWCEVHIVHQISRHLFGCWMSKFAVHDDVIKWKHFCVTGLLSGEFTGHRWTPLTKARDAEFGVFSDLRLNKWFSKQSWGWWFETPSRSL